MARPRLVNRPVLRRRPIQEEEETTIGGLLQSAGAGLAAGFTAPVRFAGAGLEVIEDITGFDLPGQTLTEISTNAQKWWQRRIGKSRAERLVGNAAETIGTIASNAALLAGGGLVAGGGLGAAEATQVALVRGAVSKGLLETLSAGAGLEKTTEALREGAPKLNAYGAGIATMATEYLTEKIPLSILQKPGISFIKRLVGGAISDVPGELIATATEISLIDKQILGKDRHLSTEEYIDILKDTAAVSVLSTIGLSGGAQVVDKTLIDAINKMGAPKPSGPHISVEKQEVSPESALAREDAKSQYPELQKQTNTVEPDMLKLTDQTADIPDTTEVPQSKGDRTAWQITQDKARAESKRLRSPSIKKAWESVVRGLVDVSGNLQAKLIALGTEGQEVVWRQNAIAGASTKGTNEFVIDSKPIYDGLTKEQKEGFDDYKAILRNKEIRRNKGADFKFADGHTIQSMDDHLATIPEDTLRVYEERNALYKQAMRKIIDLGVENGLRTQKEADDLLAQGEEYLAREVLEYLDPLVQRKTKDGKTITVRDSGIKELTETGSEKLLETDTRLLMEQGYQRIYTRIFRNNAAKAMLNLVETVPDTGKLGIRKSKIKKYTKAVFEVTNDKGKTRKVSATDATRIKSKLKPNDVNVKQIRVARPVFEDTKPNEMAITAMVDGKPQQMVMPLELGQEWVTGDPILNSSLSSFIGWVSGKKILQAMATTLNPEFAITNIPRDLAHIWLSTEEYSSLAPVAAFQMAGDMAAAVRDFKSLRKMYVDNGGGMEMLAGSSKLSLKGADPISKGFTAVENLMGKAGEFSEVVTRLALMRRAMRNGATPFQATQIARGYLDFARGGSLAKALNSGLPFFNAGIQGTRGILRAAKRNPGVFAVKAFEIGAMAFGLTMANMALWGDDYEEVSDFDKENYWIFMTNNTFIDSDGEERRHYIRIPKDQGQRTFAKVFEGFAMKTMGREVDALSITEELGNVLPIIPGELLPPAMEMFLGYSANVDFWNNEQIWRGPEVLPQEEYTKYTPEAYVKIGEVTGLSPTRTKYAVEQLFTRGNIWTSVAGYASKQVFDELTPEEREKISKEHLEKLPGVRRLLKSTRPDLKREKEIKEEKIRIQTERYKINREFDALSEEFFAGRTDKRELTEYIRRQPTPEDKKRLRTRFKRLSRLQGVSNRRFWLQLSELPPEQRAVNYWNKWVQLDEAGRRELDRQSYKVPGFRTSKRFKRTFNKMRRFGEESGR